MEKRKSGGTSERMRMMRLIAILVLAVITGCRENSFENRKTAALASGKTVEIFFEKQVSPENEPVLLVDYKTDEVIINEKAAESEVLEIWEKVNMEADKLDLSEGIIRFRFFTGERSDDGLPVYTGLLFTAEKMENGKWKIDKIF